MGQLEMWRRNGEATAEDLGAASFAGQHSTYYCVDAAHLLLMIKRCGASLWSPQAVSYRHGNCQTPGSRLPQSLRSRRLICGNVFAKHKEDTRERVCSAPLPTSVNLIGNMPPVRDQAHRGNLRGARRLSRT